MPTLQVRDLPKELYDKLVASASAERRSIAQQAIVLLERALQMEEFKLRRAEVLNRLMSRPKLPEFDPATLIREDRDQ